MKKTEKSSEIFARLEMKKKKKEKEEKEGEKTNGGRGKKMNE